MKEAVRLGALFIIIFTVAFIVPVYSNGYDPSP